MGTSDPLSEQSSLNNIGVFYCVIKNLKNKINTCHAYVHLLCLAYSQDLKVYGFNPVLDKFADEINKLTTRSFEGEFPIIGKQHVYVQLCQVSCDNLALNGIFGFWNVLHGIFCPYCYAKQDDIQTKFSENLFEKQTRVRYDADIADVTSPDNSRV